MREKTFEPWSNDLPVALTPALSRNESNVVASQLSGEGENAPRRYSLGLIGRHQAANAALAITIADELRGQGFAIPDDAYVRGLAEIQWPARIEVLQHSPTVVLDAAHNVASIAALLETLRECFPKRKRWLIFATSRDKPAEQMLRQLRTAFDEIVLTRYQNNPRAVPITELAELLASESHRRWHRPACGLGVPPKIHGQDARATVGPVLGIQGDACVHPGASFLAVESTVDHDLSSATDTRPLGHSHRSRLLERRRCAS